MDNMAFDLLAPDMTNYYTKEDLDKKLEEALAAEAEKHK